MKKNKIDWKKIFHWKNILIVVICIIAEILFSNYQAISVLLSGAEEYSININDTIIANGKESVKIEDGKITAPAGTQTYELKFPNINTEMKNLRFTFASGEGYEADVIMTFTDDNYAYDSIFNKMETRFRIRSSQNSDYYFLCSSCGKVQTLKLTFENITGRTEISSVTFNTPPKFSVNFLRLIIILSVCFIIKLGLWKKEFKEDNYSLLVRITAYVCAFLIIVTVAMGFVPGSRLFFNYPLDLEGQEEVYAQLFDAFHNGRLDLDLSGVYDVEKIKSTVNAYDFSERIVKDAYVSYLCDRAYYNGKFYSYFGFTPVIAVIYPVFLITGKLPSTLFMSMILTVFNVMSFSALYILLLKKFFDKIPALLAILGQFAFIFGSLIFVFTSDSEFYYIAMLSGLCCLTSFLYFILKAYFETSSVKKRILFLVLSGIFVVLTVESRPTLLIYDFIAIIPAVLILRSKDEKLKNKIIYVCSIGVPIVTGAIIVMIYNYLRFDSPFEFGLNYQLTICNPKANTITLSMIPTALYYYYLPHLKINSAFPYIEMPRPTYENISFHRYVYNDPITGILTYPLTWFAFLIPAMDKKNKLKFSIYVSFLSIAIVLSFVDTCIGGLNYRYSGDFLFAFNLVALAVIFDIITMAKKAPARIYALLYAVIVIAMILTIAVTTLMMFI